MRLYQLSGGGPGTQRFAYDRMNLIAEYDSSNAMLRRYVYGPGTDEPIVWYEGSGTTDRRLLHADERGSIVAVTNSSGSALSINSYDEYGLPASGNTGRFQYTGQAWLPELGIYYYKARMYASGLGRFLQTDPIGYGDGLNLYAYVGGNPINFGDPSGTTKNPPQNPQSCDAPDADPATCNEVTVTGSRLKGVTGNAGALGVGGGGSGSGGGGGASDHDKKCTALRMAINDLGNNFNTVSLVLSAASFGGAVGTLLGAAGEPDSFGADTPFTVGAFGFTTATGRAAFITGAMGNILTSIASGDISQIRNFSGISLGGLALDKVIGSIPEGQAIAKAVEGVADLVAKEKELHC